MRGCAPKPGPRSLSSRLAQLVSHHPGEVGSTLSSASYPLSYPQAGDNAALQRVYEALWAHGSKWEAGQDWRCVAHDDRRASLGVFEGDSQPVVFNCQAGCTFTDIVRALELRPADVMLNVSGGKRNGAASSGQQQRPRSATSPERKASRSRTANPSKSESDHTLQFHLLNDTPTRTRKWRYTDASDAPTVVVRRRDYDCPVHPKAIDQLKVPGGVAPKDAPYELYRLKDVRVAAASERGRIMVVAGEPSVDAAIEAGWEENQHGRTGWTVTTMRGGEKPGAWRPEYTETLAQCSHVRIVADRDRTGYRHALAVAESLGKAGVAYSVWQSKTEGSHDDVVQHIEAGGTVADLVRIKLAELRALAGPVEVVVEAIEPEVPIEEIYQHRTDTGNARRMVALHRDSIRYCPALKSWFIWNGRVWARDLTLEIMKIAKATVIQMHKEATDIEDDEKRKARVGWCLASESTGKLKAMVENAQSELVITPNDLDADPFVLCCENGTLDLKTGELRDHLPGDLITFMAPVRYEPLTVDVRWEEVLDLFVRPEDGKEVFLQRAAFASLTGDTTDKCFINLYDEANGNTGKTTFIESILSVLGPYGATVNAEAFLASPHGSSKGIRSDLAMCAGKRMVVSSETPPSRRLDTALMKKLTAGAGTYQYEEKYANPWQGRITFTIWLDGNSVAKANAEDHPLFNRWRLTPFKHQLPRGRVDPKWVERVTADGSYRAAVLAWAMKGRVAWLRKGIGTARVIEQAVAEIRDEMDPLREFWRRFEFDPNGPEGSVFFVASRAMKSAYEAWANVEMDRPLRETDFVALLKAKGVANGTQKKDGKVARGWFGVRTKSRKIP